MGFFDNLTNNGKSSQNKYAQAAQNQLQAYGTAANATIMPYAIPGTQANNVVSDLNGLNGGGMQGLRFSQFQASPLAQKLGVGGDYTASPGYKWQLGQGLSAIDASAASKGLLGSGATLKAEQEYGQGLAAQDYGNWQNRLAQTYGDYLGGLNGQINTGANTANAQANNLLTVGGANSANTAQIGANKTAGANGLAGLLGSAIGTAGKAFMGV